MDNADGKPLKSLKALVLAAGYGSRLRPLTEYLPKPLATVCGVTLFDSAVRLCLSAGADDIAVNTHHLADVMEKYALAHGLRLGARTVYVSHEPTILGTGGALVALEKWWGDSPLLVYNGDILADLDLPALAASHANGHSLVTMSVHDHPPTDGGRSVWVTPDGDVKYIAKASDLPAEYDRKTLSQHGFACAYVAGSGLRQYLPKTPEYFDLILAFNAALKAGHKITALRHTGFWADIGNPRSLWETNLLVHKMPEKVRSKILGAPAVQGSQAASGDFTVDRESVISPTAQVGKHAVIKNSVLLAGAEVLESEILTNIIRGFDLDTGFHD